MNASDRINKAINKHSDILLAAGVVAIIALLIFRVDQSILDVLLATNISIACLILLTALYIPDAMKLPSFPTILLLTTLFRLALEVAATRLILLEADAGHIINAFGNFVVAGNFVVGGVIFLILTLVQFMVVAKGSERVAEVSARFTLDAMPGKQMSIDADLRNQMITPDEARAKRQNLERESKLYGAMDGAMKFVKGDAIAGIVIALVNIIGGMIIGVLQQGMTAGEAAQTYSLLTIGDGLVSQIPALLICVSAGLIVTRVAAADSAGAAVGHVAKDIVEQVLGNPKAIAVLSVVLLATGLVPGFPKYAFWTLGAFAALISFPRLRAQGQQIVTAPGGPAGPGTTAMQPGASRPGPGAAEDEQRSQLPRRLFPVPIVLELGHDLERLFTSPDGRALPETQQMLENSVRGYLSDQLGIAFPPISFRIENSHLKPEEYAVVIFDAPIARGAFSPTQVLALCDMPTATANSLRAVATRVPWSRAEAVALSADQAQRAQEIGIRVLTAERVILNHLLVSLRRNASEFVGIQETSVMVERLKTERPDLIKAIIPVQLTVQQVAEVLKQLLRERIPVRDLRLILESLARYAPVSKDPATLAEMVRRDLRRLICARYATPQGVLNYYALHPEIERMIQEAMTETPSGPEVALAYDDQQRLITGMEKGINPAHHLVSEAIVLVALPKVRRYLAHALEHVFPDVVFLAFPEIAPECMPNQVGIIMANEGE